MVSSTSDTLSAPLLTSALLQPTILWAQGNASEKQATEPLNVDDLLAEFLPPTDNVKQSVATFANEPAESSPRDSSEINPALPTPTASLASANVVDVVSIPDESKTSTPPATSSTEPAASSSRKPLTTINQSSTNSGPSAGAFLSSKKSVYRNGEQNSANNSREDNDMDYRHLLGKTFGSKKSSAQFDGSDQPTTSYTRKPLKNSVAPAANGGGGFYAEILAARAAKKHQKKMVPKESNTEELAYDDELAENFSRIKVKKDKPRKYEDDPTLVKGTGEQRKKVKKSANASTSADLGLRSASDEREGTSSTLDYDPRPVDGSVEAGIPVFMIRATEERFCFFQPFHGSWLQSNRSTNRSLVEGEIYCFESIKYTGKSKLFKPTPLRLSHYLDRHRFVYGSSRTYRELILPALLLGSRVRDFDQRCATVMEVTEYDEIVLSMQAQNKEMNVLELKTMTGVEFPLYIADVYTGKGGKWIVTCYLGGEQKLPEEVFKDAQLEVMNGAMDNPRVSEALMQARTRDMNKPVANWKLLSAIYGKRGQSETPPAEKLEYTSFQYANKEKSFDLNKEQQEAVARYISETNPCPAFVVEAPPGSGKTVTAAAMALSYYGPGVQLFLSTANVPVINMVLALSKLDIGDMKVLHFISSEREEMMSEETQSPYTALALARKNEQMAARIAEVEGMLQYATIAEERSKLKDKIQKILQPIYDDEYHAYFATVDMILGRLFKFGNDFVKFQLLKNVRRIVVDEASQLTEAALNALILSFPKAQIVLIGDSKQMPPFKYNKGDVVSDLSARSALDVCKAKGNLPVTTLKRVYRASPSLIKHYSEVFYGGLLKSCRKEPPKNLLECFGTRAGGQRCLFWEVAGKQSQSGNSLVNEEEMVNLRYIVATLRQSGLKRKDIMIISYYEAQRKKAEEELPEGYEVLTVDSAQGREKKVVIVLTTRSVSTDTGSFITCPLRCNVAVSRHQKALIVLGHKSITTAPNWADILKPQYFKHVEPFNIIAETKKAKKDDEW